MGEEVSYDGAHRRQDQLLKYFADRVEWVPVCPEVEVGMGVPRETIELVATPDGLQLVGTESARNHTQEMRVWAAQRLEELEGISGYVLKARSPSCGLRDVPVRNLDEPVSGVFTSSLLERFPDMPVVEDEEIADAQSLAAFEQSVRAYALSWLGKR